GCGPRKRRGSHRDTEARRRSRLRAFVLSAGMRRATREALKPEPPGPPL
ncbi:MAG: hypothetical protein AVDCRST_MAG68-4460, partial [uncultured Gemmatimonadetes bacterium]